MVVGGRVRDTDDGRTGGGRGSHRPGTTEFREFPMPDIPDDGALMKVEVAGICGTDVKKYAAAGHRRPVIMGHENVGVIAKAGRQFTERQVLARVTASFSSTTCPALDASGATLGSTGTARPRTGGPIPTLAVTGTPRPRTRTTFGGIRAVHVLALECCHAQGAGRRVRRAGRNRHAAVERHRMGAVRRALGYSSTVLIQGPGQQGLSQTVACKQAGASLDHRDGHDPGCRAFRAREDPGR